jgi:hypothetical protein
MTFHVGSTPALALAAAIGLILCSGFHLPASIAAELAGTVERTAQEVPRGGHKALLQASRKAVVRTGQAIVGVTKTAGRVVGWVFVKTISSLFDDDVDTRDPVRAQRDEELNSWIESRDKWLRQERSK